MEKSFGWMLVVGALACSAATGQERLQPRQGTAPAAAAQVSRADQEIAAVKLAFCRNEVELAKLAAQKAQSEDVKQFAAQMVKEHTAGCAKLEKWAGNLATAAPAAGTGAEVRVQPGAQPGGRPGVEVTARAGQSGPLNWIAIHQQMAEQCLTTSKEELNKKEGADFDKCFMGMALGGHQQAIVADHVFLNYASPQFRGEVEECLKNSTAHFNEAKQIMEKLAGNTPRTAN